MHFITITTTPHFSHRIRSLSRTDAVEGDIDSDPSAFSGIKNLCIFHLILKSYSAFPSLRISAPYQA